MPALVGHSRMPSLEPLSVYASTIVTRNGPQRNSTQAYTTLGLEQRNFASRSVVNRRGSPDLSSMLGNGLSPSTSNRPAPSLYKSASIENINLVINSTDEKLQRSQLNIDRKMKEDFDRLQK